MRTLTKAAGLLFLAASSVYSDSGIQGAGGGVVTTPPRRRSEPTSVKPLEDATDPFAAPTGPAIKSATQPTNKSTASVPSAPPTAFVPPAKPLAASDVAISDSGTFVVHVNEANLTEVLRMLSLQSQKNIIASNQVRGTITANLYDVTVKEALDAILKSNGYDYREKGNFIYVYTAKEVADMEKASAAKKTELIRLFYTPAANAANMIKPALSPEGQVALTAPAVTGIGTDDKDAGGNSHSTEDVLVITDYPANLEQAKAIIKELDRRPQQILVEAVILRATLQENNDLGIDFTAVGGVDFSTLSGIGSAGAGSGLSQALSGQIIENSAAGNVNNHGFVAGSAGGSGLKLGVVKNNVGLFLSALEGITDTVVMANPKVLVVNKQKGEVHVGSEQGYRTAVATETLTADDVKFLETGTRLAFRPYIGDNGNIRLEIHPEDSSGSVNAAGLPNKFVTQVTTNVMVKDGHTIVIGGLFREATDRGRSGVPGLQNLPGIGPAFRHQTDNTVREEVIILLTPHIVKDEATFAAAGEDLLKEAERLRVGMRRGLMPWGRERLAESWYEAASAEMDKPNPNPNRAMWFLNAATNANPVFTEAIAMKAKISGRELTTSDNSSVHSFVTNQILAERKGGFTPEQLPAMVPISPATHPVAPVEPAIPAMLQAAKPAGPATQPMVAAPAQTQPAAALPVAKSEDDDVFEEVDEK